MYKTTKRILDVIIASVALVILSPMLILVVIVLKFTGEGEVFYFQKRVGQNGQFFDIWKFATMLKNSPNMGPGLITVRKDPRVTTIGSFLRKTKLNELPQVINVLIGNMSIVGPRPTVQKHYEAYPKQIGKLIYANKPGITGIGSLVFRDEEELISNSGMQPFEFYKEIIIPYKGKLELWYTDHASIRIDLMIILLTAWVILFPKSNLVYKLFRTLPKRPEFLHLNPA